MGHRNDNDNSAGTVTVPIPLDWDTRMRLAWLARLKGDQPVRVAADLLRDLLIDDELNDQPPGGVTN